MPTHVAEIIDALPRALTRLECANAPVEQQQNADVARAAVSDDAFGSHLQVPERARRVIARFSDRAEAMLCGRPQMRHDAARAGLAYFDAPLGSGLAARGADDDDA